MDVPMPDVTIGPLEPGLYVIEFPDRVTDETAHRIQQGLKDLAPEFRFIVLDGGARIAREPVEVPA